MMWLVTACSPSEPEQLTEVDGSVAEEAALFVESYKEQMIKAVNTGNFNLLEPYLITNNSFYHSLRRYVDDLHGSRITKELVEFTVETVYVDEMDEPYVDARETVIMHESTGEKVIERSTQFELIRGGDDSLRVITIKERK